LERRRSNMLSEDELKIVEGGKIQTKTYTITFDEALDLFIKDCMLRNLRPDTVRYYQNELTTFKKLLEEQEIPTDPALITESVIEEGLILYMMEHGAKLTSINTRASCCVFFL
jgi:integrase/recombinase XerD